MLTPWTLLAILMISHLIFVDAFLSVTSFHTQRILHVDHNDNEEFFPPLMGIKGFRSWFETSFSSAVITIDPDRHKAKSSNKRNAGGTEPEIFDHVLIDANQFLHTTLRTAYNRRPKRSKGSILTDGQQLDEDVTAHSLLLFLKEINRIARTTAVPRKSLVIAIDGSPGAAKLEMQRRRRFSIYKKAESQERQIEVLEERGWRDNDFGFYSKKRTNPLLSKHERERVTLNITPGTAFMESVTNALLYFSYQYVTRFPGVRVYISPSSVHGEGEVKILDWIMHGHDQALSSTKRRMTLVKQNETVAILGGDSDLVLMGLVVPPSVTHNIHVILPEKNSKSLVVSVWETSRIMAKMIEGTATYGGVNPAKKKRLQKRKRRLSLSQINQARIDTALLIIMNGNDYLPKIRGCKGFDPFFKVYLNVLVKMWPRKESGSNGGIRPFFIEIDSNDELCLNVPFALAFFRALPSDCLSPTNGEDNSSSSQSQLLGTLNNLVEAKILPGPISYTTISPEESFFQQELLEMNSKLNKNTIIDDVFADGAEIVRLTLGHFPDAHGTSTMKGASNAASKNGVDSQEIFTTVLGESDGHGVVSRMIRSKNSTEAGGRAYLFEVPHRAQSSSIKTAKYRLSRLALEEIFGVDNVDELFFANDSGYESEMKNNMSLHEKPQSFAQADARHYLGGLLWNLETYRHGCCADYGYDYGRRPSPTPLEIVDFLENEMKEGREKVKCFDWIDRSATDPLSDGLACLAAVPPQAWHLVPEPYNWFVEPSRSSHFQDLWDSCFNPENNAFDIQSFEKKCNEQLSKIKRTRTGQIDTPASEVGATHRPYQKKNSGRQIYAGSKFWTVMSLSHIPLAHPFEPPKPFSGRISKLRKNKRIRVTKLPVKTRIERVRNTEVTNNPFEGDDSEARQDDQGIQAKENIRSVHDIPYKIAYKNRNRKSIS
eukprot:CAMPEP_0172540468 /NCGR_PEP_ID=MMETSP1067-20121228/11479_1 /TAXON_ID=265564 ORGANISM="Thalassiosira punctigera, Strain Tpunct2005C2" /NCGR_SAMPLE_ID=MMETSP1067 /ASSEMBLY_ACC=CAM_ASM_000444 /LENGTH=940 /DNA_ID=CAMNT_0013326335 /DNA_START=208 /DNA_END=3030 /DNA_ORIENTATION=-